MRPAGSEFDGQEVAVILAAGRSSRLGRPKALLEWGGETFLARLVRVFRAASVAPVVVTGGAYQGSHAAAIEEEIGRLGVESYVNPDPTAGPRTSVQAALDGCAAVATATSLLWHPVDIPALTVDDVTRLRAATEAHPEVDAFFLSHERRRLHPVWVRATLVPRIRALGGAATLRDLWSEEGVGVHYVECENALLAHDVDTPEDYAELLEHSPG